MADYNTLVVPAIIAIMVWHNTYYINRSMFPLNIDGSNCPCTKLPPCDSCAHLEYHVPE